MITVYQSIADIQNEGQRTEVPEDKAKLMLILVDAPKGSTKGLIDWLKIQLANANEELSMLKQMPQLENEPDEVIQVLDDISSLGNEPETPIVQVAGPQADFDAIEILSEDFVKPSCERYFCGGEIEAPCRTGVVIQIEVHHEDGYEPGLDSTKTRGSAMVSGGTIGLDANVNVPRSAQISVPGSAALSVDEIGSLDQPKRIGGGLRSNLQATTKYEP